MAAYHPASELHRRPTEFCSGVPHKGEPRLMSSTVPHWQRGVVAIGVRKSLAPDDNALIGSGWIVDLDRGLLCTCAHVAIDCFHASPLDPKDYGLAIGVGIGERVRWVRRAKLLLVSQPPLEPRYPHPIPSTWSAAAEAREMIVYNDERIDLAILQLCEWTGGPLQGLASELPWHRDGEPAGALPLGRTSEPELVEGHELVLLGYGQGSHQGGNDMGFGAERTSTTCRGHYAGRFEKDISGAWLKLGVTIYSGHSGGPVVNASSGAVVGWAVHSVRGDLGPNGKARPIEALEKPLRAVLDHIQCEPIGRPARERLRGQLESRPMHNAEQGLAARDEARAAAAEARGHEQDAALHTMGANAAAVDATSSADRATCAASAASSSAVDVQQAAETIKLAASESWKAQHCQAELASIDMQAAALKQYLLQQSMATYHLPAPVDMPGAQPITKHWLSQAMLLHNTPGTGASTSTDGTSTTLTSPSMIPHEMITLCIEGDISAFDDARVLRLRKVLALLLDDEICNGDYRLVQIELNHPGRKRMARVGTRNCEIKIAISPSLRDDSMVVNYGSETPSDSSSTSSVEDIIEAKVKELTKSSVWPSGVGVDDIDMVWKRGGSVLLVLLMHPVAAHALFQLARQRCAPLLDEGIRCCKLGDHVARLDDRDGIEDCVRKTHEAASEALQDGAGALASPVPSQADDKQRAFEAWVDPGMRDALRQRARKLLDANPCFLRALQMVEISTVDPERKTEIRLWIHVVLQPDKQRVSYRVLKALQGSDFGREEWCLPNKSLLRNNGIEHNVECFRHVMSQAGPDNYEEIPDPLEPRPMILPNGSAEANQKERNYTENNFWSNLWNALLNSLVDTRNEWNM